MADFKTHEEELKFLEEIGFQTNPINSKTKDLNDVWSKFEELSKNRESLAYQIDGLVIKLNNLKLQEELGIVGKTARSWGALKFKAEEVTSKILDITWQVGRTGKVTPVAELEAVDLDGTTVKRATLHNSKELEERDIHIGDTVIIRKAGDIIPEVVQILEKLRDKNAAKPTLPYKCPVCSHQLRKSSTEVDLLCTNQESCPAQVLGRLSYFAGRSIGNIAGLSEKNIQKFMEEFGIKDLYDLYDLPYSKIFELEGFGSKSVENLKTSIKDSLRIKDYKFLAGLSIEGVGPEVAKLIVGKMLEKKI